MPYPYFGYGYPGLDLGSVAQPVLGQMPPSFGVDPETQRAAVNQMLIAMGANILGAPIGDYTGALGAGFAGGQQAYQGEIARARELQQQDFRNRMAMEELALSQAAGQRAEQGLIMEGQRQKAAFAQDKADARVAAGETEASKAEKLQYLIDNGDRWAVERGYKAMLGPERELNQAYADMKAMEAFDEALRQSTEETVAGERALKREGLGRYYESGPGAAANQPTIRELRKEAEGLVPSRKSSTETGDSPQWQLPNGQWTDKYGAALEAWTDDLMVAYGLVPEAPAGIQEGSPADRARQGGKTPTPTPQPPPSRGAGGGFTHPGAFLVETAINQQRKVSRDFELDTEVRGKIDALRAEMSPEQQAALDSYIQQVVAQFGYVMSPEARTLIFRKANQLLMGR